MAAPRIRRLTVDEWEVMRAVRIAALSDAPEAFGSTLAREQSLAETDWRGRLARGSQLVAADGDDVLGTIGLISEPGRESEGHVVSMWVAPSARGRGIGDALVQGVLKLAESVGYSELGLWVAEGNGFAEALYERNGFARTGAVQPIRESEPDRLEFAMARAIGDVSRGR